MQVPAKVSQRSIDIVGTTHTSLDQGRTMFQIQHQESIEDVSRHCLIHDNDIKSHGLTQSLGYERPIPNGVLENNPGWRDPEMKDTPSPIGSLERLACDENEPGHYLLSPVGDVIQLVPSLAVVHLPILSVRSDGDVTSKSRGDLQTLVMEPRWWKYRGNPSDTFW